MKTLCIYHANCADGFGAAWAVRQALGADNVEFLPGHYGQPAPNVEGRDVIIVDFSYPYELLMLLGHQARSILIIDHHKTAAEDLARLQPAPQTFAEWLTTEQRVGTVFDMQRSGAGLTWDYLVPDKPRPRLINHIEDRDLWQFALPGTKDVMAAVFSYPQDFHLWDELMKQHLSELRTAGHAIRRAHDKNVAELVQNARRLYIGGHDVPTLNCPHYMASDAGHILAQGEPFAACYSDTPKGRVFSLRSQPEGLDVSEIAKQYGGGGHRNAAGFTVPFNHELVTGHVLATLECTTPTPQPVERDEYGHWTHPAWPRDGEENAIPTTWFAEHGLELFIVDFESDAPQELSDAYFEQGNPDCTAWKPSQPPGEGWFVFSIHDTEDGPTCVWARALQDAAAGEQP